MLKAYHAAQLHIIRRQSNIIAPLRGAGGGGIVYGGDLRRATHSLFTTRLALIRPFGAFAVSFVTEASPPRSYHVSHYNIVTKDNRRNIVLYPLMLQRKT